MSPNEKTTLTEFGPRLDGVHYIDRPSVYAVIENAKGQIAVIEFDHDHFLPGGGKMPGESDEAALIREIREETGDSAVIHEKTRRGGRIPAIRQRRELLPDPWSVL